MTEVERDHRTAVETAQAAMQAQEADYEAKIKEMQGEIELAEMATSQLADSDLDRKQMHEENVKLRAELFETKETLRDVKASEEEGMIETEKAEDLNKKKENPEKAEKKEEEKAGKKEEKEAEAEDHDE